MDIDGKVTSCCKLCIGSTSPHIVREETSYIGQKLYDLLAAEKKTIGEETEHVTEQLADR